MAREPLFFSWRSLIPQAVFDAYDYEKDLVSEADGTSGFPGRTFGGRRGYGRRRGLERAARLSTGEAVVSQLSSRSLSPETTSGVPPLNQLFVDSPHFERMSAESSAQRIRGDAKGG